MSDDELTPRPGDDGGAASADDAAGAGAPGGRSRWWGIVAVVFGIASVLMAGLAVVLWTTGEDPAEEPTPAPRDITGVVTFVAEGYAGVPGPDCRAELGAGEVAGAAAFLVDGTGRQLATGTLGEGTKAATFECRFTVVFPAVPAATAYRLTVEGGISSEVVPASQLEANGGVITAASGTLGS